MAGTDSQKDSSRGSEFQPSSIGLCAASTTEGCSGTVASNQGLPVMLVGTFAQLGATSSVPRHRVDTNNQAIDDFSWNMNKHSVKFGFEFRRTSVTQYFDKYFRGKLSFASLSDFLSGTVSTDFGDSFDYFGNPHAIPTKTAMVFTSRMATESFLA
jgi:hypothetical protein